MKVDYQIDTVEYRAEEMKKSLSGHSGASAVAVKLALIKKSVRKLSDVARLYNKFSVSDE